MSSRSRTLHIGQRIGAPQGDPAQPGVRIGTLLALRWIAILGQLIALAVIAQMFGQPGQLSLALLVVGASVLLNIGCGIFYPRGTFLSGRLAAVQLAFDLVQLCALLYLTGGITNPFSVMVLVPVTISATLLSLRSTIILFVLAMLLISALALWSLPLPWSNAEPLVVPQLYRFGVWVSLLVGMTFLTVYAWRVSAEARRRQEALIATQAALARAQQMSAVGSLAAAAAHELGSPLGTMTLVTRDLQAELGDDPDFGEDIALLASQLERSRDILKSISAHQAQEEHFQTVSLEALLYEVTRPHMGGRAALSLEVSDPVRTAQIERSPELLHGLDNLLANATRHAAASIKVSAFADNGGVTVRIRDDGHGFADELFDHLGEPDVNRYGAAQGGLGLGLFIASNLLERIGAKLRFTNNAGAIVDIHWSATASNP
jgi:two-component system, sensor histidine kinase RegB